MAELVYNEWIKQAPQHFFNFTPVNGAGGRSVHEDRVYKWNEAHDLATTRGGMDNAKMVKIIKKVVNTMASAGLSTHGFDYEIPAAGAVLAHAAFTQDSGKLEGADPVSDLRTVLGSQDNVDAFIPNFLNMWFMFARVDGFTAPGTPSVPGAPSPLESSKFSIDANGNVRVYGKDGKEINTYVNVMPSSKNLEDCGVNESCSSIMYILSSKNRNDDLATKVLDRMTKDYEEKNPPGQGDFRDEKVRKHNAVVTAYAILRRLNWKGTKVDGQKKVLKAQDLTKAVRADTRLRGDLKEMYTTLDAAGNPVKLTDAVMNEDDTSWKARFVAGAPNNIAVTATPTGDLVNKCIEYVNANPNILNRANDTFRQRFLPDNQEEINKSRILGLGMASKFGFPGYAAIAGPMGFLYGARHRGGSMTGGSTVDQFGGSGSSDLRKQLHSLVSQLNSKGRMLANPVLAKFEGKLKQIEALEKEIDEFAKKFALFNEKHADQGTGDVNEDEMKAAKAKYEEDAKKWTKKVWVVQSAMGNMEMKIKEFEREAGTDVPDTSFTL